MTTILAVLDVLERDRIIESAALRAGWNLIWINSVDEARTLLTEDPPGVVLCEQTMADGKWQDFLACECVRDGSTRLIVTSRLADAALWAEVLNLGGYDVLAQPFDEHEVIRILGPETKH